ncbi:rhodopsin, GQ-coupled-like [Dysidea avara]|uniref:rhodopsin, GQ-coupled-like n=1 Tax=Dysidea avara TaxID=196820 RepID=UPI00332299CD
MDYSGSGLDQDRGSVLPGYVAYLSLLFKMIATTVNLLLSGWVVYTIKTTRSLHKPHNLFLANLLVSGVMFTGVGSLITSTMMISYQLGVESPISCYPSKIQVLFFIVYQISFVMIAADKVVAIRFPFKHRRMMTPRVVAAVICVVWLLAAIPAIYVFINDVDGVTEVPEFGICLFEGNGFTELVLLVFAPLFLASILTISLNVFLAIKAYQVHKQIEEETKLSGHNSQSENLKTLKKKQQNIRQNRKLIMTLLVVISSHVLINLFFTPLLILGRLLITSQGYQDFLNYIFFPNNPLVTQFFDVLVYGMYFKQVREPMMRNVKRCLKMNKFNSVAPKM